MIMAASRSTYMNVHKQVNNICTVLSSYLL